jgi:protoporphyrinogen/coproporphyrinogen III oxidase
MTETTVSDPRPSVIVVGGGPSGLAAGWRLQQAGCRVRILEDDDHAGGKVVTHHRDGYVIDAGASILPAAYTHLLKIVHEVGIADHLLPGGTVVGFARDRDIHYLDSAHLIRDALRTRLLSPRSKLLMTRLALDAVRIRPYLNYENLAPLGFFDDETANGYGRRRLNDEITEYIIDGVLRGLLGTSGEINSKISFFFSFSNIIGTTLLSLRGGMQTYVDALAASLDITTGARVEQVKETPDAATVTWRSLDGATHSDAVDAVVLAVWGTQVPHLYPQLHPVCRAYLDDLRYTTSVHLSAALSAPPKDNPAFVVCIPESVHPDLFAIVLDHNKAPDRAPVGKGLASLYTMSRWSQRLIDEDDETVTSSILTAGDRVIPGLSDLVEFTEVHRWHPVVVYSHPGTYRDLASFNAHRPRQRVHLAGDYFSCSNLNTATVAGERAARELLATTPLTPTRTTH